MNPLPPRNRSESFFRRFDRIRLNPIGSNQCRMTRLPSEWAGSRHDPDAAVVRRKIRRGANVKVVRHAAHGIRADEDVCEIVSVSRRDRSRLGFEGESLMALRDPETFKRFSLVAFQEYMDLVPLSIFPIKGCILHRVYKAFIRLRNVIKSGEFAR